MKLSKFHQQVLLQWKMMFKHNFSPHNVPLWNNRAILSRKKSVFMEDWMVKQIWSITHLMDGTGEILVLDDFNAKYNTNCSIEIYKKVTQNIPKVLLHSIKNMLNIPTPNLHKIKIEDMDLVNDKCNNKFLRQYLVNTFYPSLAKSTLTLKDYDKSKYQLFVQNI